MDSRTLNARITLTKALVVDDDPYMCKVVRTMLMTIGVRSIEEAPEGVRGLDGVQFLRTVPSPVTFPYPNVPIIMLSGHGDGSAWSMR